MQQVAIILKLDPPVVAIKLNVVYNTTTQTFDFSPDDFSPDDFSTT